jgi:hypothetical protein
MPDLGIEEILPTLIPQFLNGALITMNNVPPKELF